MLVSATTLTLIAPSLNLEEHLEALGQIMRLRIAILAPVLAFAWAPTDAFALGQDGHRIVCKIAETELSNAARAEVDRLLALDPDFSDLSEACLWADQVRNSTHRETGPWHFINLDKDDLIVDSSDCPVDKGCVLHGVAVHLAALNDDDASDSGKLEALKFLGHWIGDLHQPLHISFFEDRGGNSIDIRWLGAKDTNLHSVWDTQMILTYQRDNWNSVVSAERWQAFAQELTLDISGSERVAWRAGAPTNWAQESYDISRDPGVLYLELDDSTRHPLGRSYFNRNIPILKERLQQAGVRLGTLLNRVFR